MLSALLGPDHVQMTKVFWTEGELVKFSTKIKKNALVMVRLRSSYGPVMVWLWSGYGPVMVRLWSGYGPVIVWLLSGYCPVYV